MKAWLIAVVMGAMTILVSGCGTTIQSNVTTFHEWPASLPDKHYVFERTKEQNNNLEYLNYENLVREQLNRLGFTEASPSTPPTLKVSLGYSVDSRDVREVYPVVVNPYPYPYWYGPAWRGYYGPFYDPFWYGPPMVEQRVSQYRLYTRHLRIVIARMSDGKQLYETTVVSEGTNGSLAAVMPYMVRAAFTDFPGKSGVPHQVELKMQ
ncbi:MAG TPA: DUF4136 domain-containing protein [Noviherbaspirillum sp.]|uniref:DUF4136 domain-containing protein n=1 Tax=Noviherbaspirillum sp. TaxID=1926288 RepID=UPI002B488164|nr:DUF4136 domain-containing protein [Noviherbaspirillum sp.]HJV84366.1 DUF4136 domain-containing protein [Noviherbaspirillum sp.]